MSLAKYEMAAHTHAAEIRDLVPYEMREQAFEMMQEKGLEYLHHLVARHREKAVIFLGKTEKQRDVQFSKLEGSERLELWLSARYWSLHAARVLSVAMELSMLEGASYRKMTKSAALADLPASTDMTLEKIVLDQ